ncbi:CBL-interacting protein kinase 16-like [Ananas comosus]|uniref:non-specific serine/threonine protein kinase n=1 Tax=Ananas comosus TaxID=4615 RepID=A0A6P5EI84_ANACO|nr:CBL-interacting protein kinase 16-like [Ananas comosus]
MATPAEEEDERNLILGKYEMGRVLGKGTFATVYHGRDLRSGESVAIKVIGKDRVRREEGMMDQIRREISVMRLVRHPNVVELREVMATKSRIFFVMELVRGGDLFDLVSKHRRGLPEDQARRYFQQLIAAVDFCHSRGVCHRDLKLENLLLDASSNTLKVSDFGLSALPEQLRHDGMLHTQCGTPAYVAPELLKKKGYDGMRADMWSCGVILFVLLSGYLPFQHENIMKMYNKICRAKYQLPPWVSADAGRLIGRLLVSDPEKRISIAEMMQLPWFKKGLPQPISLGPRMAVAVAAEEEETGDRELDPDPDPVAAVNSPRSYNAFELISAMSSGFDLSRMFGSELRAGGTVFTARLAAGRVMERLEKVGRALGFRAEKSVKAGWRVRMERPAVVEFGKDAGDTLEFARFCEHDVRPGLKDIVWAWQGDPPSLPTERPAITCTTADDAAAVA